MIRVFADTDRTDCGELVNNVNASGSNLGEPLTASASIDVKCPTIALDKENDAVGSVLPGTAVNYTLTVTISDGPAKAVVIEDDMPEGLETPTNISDGGLFVRGYPDDPLGARRSQRWDLRADLHRRRRR